MERFSKWGADFGSKKWCISGDQNWRDSAGHRTCATQGVSEGECAPLRNLTVFENVILRGYCTQGCLFLIYSPQTLGNNFSTLGKNYKFWGKKGK